MSRTDETFSAALDRLLDGERVRRAGWAPDTWLVLVPGSTVTVTADRPLGRAFPDRVGERLTYGDHIDLVAEDRVEPWVPTQSDLLAADWEAWS